jgi:Cft2 family RNA processing exonuclease
MLRDVAHIQEEDADFMNRKHADELEEPVVSPFDMADVLKAMQQFRALAYHQPTPALPGVNCTLLDAGHVLGSAIVQSDIDKAPDRLRLVFSGDLGRKIADRASTVRIIGTEHSLEAEVVVMDAFSAHADQDNLLECVKGCRSSHRKLFLVHGE